MGGVIYVNVTTADGELLERIEVELQPGESALGSVLARAALLDEIEGAARVVLARAADADGERVRG